METVTGSKMLWQNKQAACASSELVNFEPLGIYSVVFSCNLRFLQAAQSSELSRACSHDGLLFTDMVLRAEGWAKQG